MNLLTLVLLAADPRRGRWHNPGEVAASNREDDPNGYVDG